MSLDASTIYSLAILARIDPSIEGSSMFVNDVVSILHWVEQLQSVNTEGVEPMQNLVFMPLYLREDIVNDTVNVNHIMANAPESLEDFFLVPKSVE